METKSFTLRLPINIFDEVTKRAGEGKRSEFIIQLLKESLGLEDEEDKAKKQSSIEIAAQINELFYKIEIAQTRYDSVIQRLAALEENNVLQSNSDSKTDNVLPSNTQSKTVSVLQNNTESKTNDVLQDNTDGKTNTVLQSQAESKTNDVLQSNTDRKTEEIEVKNLALLPEDGEIPESAKKLNSASLLEIVRDIEPQQGWTPQKLRVFRDDRKKDTWHQIGQYKFKFAERDDSRGKRPEYHWWVVSLEG